MSVNETHAEATAEKSSAVGNVARMREALKSVAAWLLERFGNPADPDHDKAEEFYILTTGVLAAPPRNCDRFNTGDLKRDAQDAMEAMLDEGVAGFRGMAEYLLSPVCTERKGEGDGSK